MTKLFETLKEESGEIPALPAAPRAAGAPSCPSRESLLLPVWPQTHKKKDERLLFHPFPQHSDTVKAIPQLVRMRNSGVGDPKAVVSPTKPGGKMPKSIQPGWEHKAHL